MEMIPNALRKRTLSLGSVVRCFVPLFGLWLVPQTAELGAQTVDGAALDLTFGPSDGHGSAHAYWDTVVPTAAITLMPSHASSLPVAITIGIMPQFAHSSICRIDIGGTGCDPRWPGLGYFGVLGGVAHTVAFLDYRALVGPVLVASSRGGAGGQLLFDAAAGSRHLAFVVGVRGSYAVLFDRERLRFGSLEVGARIR